MQIQILMCFQLIYLVIKCFTYSYAMAFPDDFFDLYRSCDALYKERRIEYEELKQNYLLAPRPSLINVYLYRSYDTPIKFPLPSAAQGIMNSADFNRSLPVVLYMPGFLESPAFPSIVMMTNNLLIRGGMNVLHLDADAYLGNPWYLYVAMSTRFIGEFVGNLLADMVKDGVSEKNIHLIGFSFGAHIAGYSAKQFRKFSGRRLARISGIDPAGMCFYANPPSMRLDKTDADFVDVIHSNAGNWGINKRIGHVDFFPNGGQKQPLMYFSALSHNLGWMYYVHSILFPGNFKAVQCADWISFKNGLCYKNNRSLMGFAASPLTRGVYFLKTRILPPYGLGEKSVPKNFKNYLFPFL